MPLSINDIEAAQPCINGKGEPTDKPYKLGDAGGLYLIVFPSGDKCWRFKYRFGRKERQASLGCYPDVSLKEARIGRNRLRELLDNVIDPCIRLKAERAAIRDEESRQLAATRFMLSNNGALFKRIRNSQSFSICAKCKANQGQSVVGQQPTLNHSES